MQQVERSSNDKTIALVFHFTPNSTRSVEQFLLKISEKFENKGFKQVHCYTGEPSNDYRMILEDLGITYIVFKPIEGVFDGIKLALKLKPYSPDILFTGFYSPFNLGVWAIKMVTKSKYWVLNDHSSGVASHKRGILKLIAKIRGKFVGQLIDLIICVSDYVRLRDINEIFLPEHKAVTIHNGIDIDRFNNNSKTIEASQNSELTIAYAGQLIEEKGIDTLLRALSSLSYPYKLLIAGSGAYENELKKLGKELSINVEWLGHIDSVPKLFSAADVAVFPSAWAEAFGLVIIEAMSCGTCVIASKVGGIPEVIGDAGMLFQAHDEKELQLKIEELASKPALRKQLAEAAKSRVHRLFDLETVGDKYSDELYALYKKSLAES